MEEVRGSPPVKQVTLIVEVGMVAWENHHALPVFSHEAPDNLKIFTSDGIAFVHHPVIAEDCIKDLDVFLGGDVLVGQLAGQVNGLLKDDPAIISASDPCVIAVRGDAVIA